MQWNEWLRLVSVWKVQNGNLEDDAQILKTILYIHLMPFSINVVQPCKWILQQAFTNFTIVPPLVQYIFRIQVNFVNVHVTHERRQGPEFRGCYDFEFGFKFLKSEWACVWWCSHERFVKHKFFRKFCTWTLPFSSVVTSTDFPTYWMGGNISIQKGCYTGTLYTAWWVMTILSVLK